MLLSFPLELVSCIDKGHKQEKLDEPPIGVQVFMCSLC